MALPWPDPMRAGVQLGALLDTLALFSARGGGSTYGGGGGDAGSGHGVLTMQYPGVDDSLVLGMEDASEALCTDAEMRTHVLDPADDGAQAIALQADAVAFAVEASVLRDAVEDLEAVASVASVALLPTPPCAILSAEGNGSVNIELAGDAIRQWAVGVPLQFTYKVKVRTTVRASAMRGAKRLSAITGVRTRALTHSCWLSRSSCAPRQNMRTRGTVAVHMARMGTMGTRVVPTSGCSTKHRWRRCLP